MVRTRADANTVQARNNDTSQREQAFASGAQAISTDYYLPAQHFGNDYQVQIPGVCVVTAAHSTPLSARGVRRLRGLNVAIIMGCIKVGDS